MRSKAFRSVAFLMALVLALSSLILLPIGAQEDEKYFIFDLLADENGTEYDASGAQLSLPLSANAVFSATNPVMLSAQSNAFYVALQNSSNATKIRITYTYKVQSGSATEPVEGEIARNTDKQIITLPAANLGEEIEKIDISFACEDTLGGTVRLYAFFDISTYSII